MQNYAYAHGGQMRGPRREGPQDEGFVSHPTHPVSLFADRFMSSSCPHCLPIWSVYTPPSRDQMGLTGGDLRLVSTWENK